MRSKVLLYAAAVLFVSVFIGCSQDESRGEHERSGVLTDSKESHERDYESGEGEEEGTLFDLDFKYDSINNGVRLVLSYDEVGSKFAGSVENVTNNTLENVRVEIHLSNGKELGPTMPVSLEAGGLREIQIDAQGEIFEKWNTHAEVGRGEHSREESEIGEHSGHSEHERRERGERH